MSEENKVEESNEEIKEDTQKTEQEDEKKKKKKWILLLILLLLLLIIILIFSGIWFFFIRQPVTVVVNTPITEVTTEAEQADPDKPSFPTYDSNAVAIDKDSLQAAVDSLYKTEEGYITVDFFNEAYSNDGLNYTCRFGNAADNRYAAFVTVYLESYEEPYYLSGLLRPGEMFNTFKGEYQLDTGVYNALLVFTQINDDHTAIVGQTSIALTLKVSPDLEIRAD